MTSTLLTPPIDNATRRQFLALLSAAGLAGCAAPSTPAPTAATRPFTHLAGNTDIPTTPERVVLLNDFVLANLLDAGFRPLGTAGTAGSLRISDTHDLTGITVLGEVNTPDPEAVAGLRPDLIIGLAGSMDTYATWSAIAPTVLLDTRAGDLFHFDRTILDTVGRTADLDRRVAEYEGRITELRPRFVDLATRVSVNVISGGYAPGEFSVQGTDQYPRTPWAIVLTDLGLIPRTSVPAFEEVSLERVGEWSADVVFIQDGTAEELDAPTLRALPASVAGQVHVVEGNDWTGPRTGALDIVLDDLVRLLLDRPVRSGLV